MKNMLLMLLLCVFLGYILTIRDDSGKKNSFFDQDTTSTLRGFWCLVIMLVHVPERYQNPIQDILGSFAYIGVSFFFMTSGYGLMLAVRKNSALLERFWKHRLLKLLIPILAVNLLTMVAEILMGELNIWTLVSIPGFVRQLVLLYSVFWLVFRFPVTDQNRDFRIWILCGSVFAISWLIYVLDGAILFGWPVESLGFLYGVLLARYRDSFVRKVSSGWLMKCVASCIAALLCGVLYLETKSVPIWGDFVIKALLGISILIFILCVNACYSIGSLIGRFLGGISYEIYLLHGLVFSCIHYASEGLDSGAYIILSILVTVILSVWIHWGCKQVFRRVK